MGEVRSVSHNGKKNAVNIFSIFIGSKNWKLALKFDIKTFIKVFQNIFKDESTV